MHPAAVILLSSDTSHGTLDGMTSPRCMAGSKQQLCPAMEELGLVIPVCILTRPCDLDGARSELLDEDQGQPGMPHGGL